MPDIKPRLTPEQADLLYRNTPPNTIRILDRMATLVNHLNTHQGPSTPGPEALQAFARERGNVVGELYRLRGELILIAQSN